MRELPQPKAEDFDLATVLHALGDPVRLELLRRLAADGWTSCLPDGITVPRSTLSNHWRILREAGITETRIDGKNRLMILRRSELDSRFPGFLDAVLGGSAPA
ncbi:helix-turn-helix transcriptional regulator [Streptacidiphilus sp. P02-A3a]|uniref:ArsR/SmtB family transcription factor n=1 Tax=Streptacidiphilus sp. P02-A3a TaxID=2704468 RepID=UPI0015FE7B8F|nr:helix-turn-helix domain-containing protein [Streptacidiphilus sp. P02-A3a]QMU67536.1 helix-turn-helix transcriptional regulator [Streptacidiphilus sp. P02-A3a]